MKIQQMRLLVVFILLYVESMATMCLTTSLGQEPRRSDFKCLAIMPLSEDPNIPPLALVRHYTLPKPEDLKLDQEAEQRYDKIAPKTNLRSFSDPIGNVAFIVMRPRHGVVAKALEGERVLGIVYAHDTRPDLAPFPVWKGALIYSPPSKSAYLVLAQGRGIGKMKRGQVSFSGRPLVPDAAGTGRAGMLTSHEKET